MMLVVTRDGDRVQLCAPPPGPQFVVVHAMLDRGNICPPDPALHARHYARYFPALSEEVEHKGLVLSGHPCEVVLSRRSVASVAVCLSGDSAALAEIDGRWTDTLVRWAPMFVSRDRLSVLFTPTILPLEQYGADFFQHHAKVPCGFNPRVFAQDARAPFTLMQGGCDMIACHHAHDAQTLAA